MKPDTNLEKKETLKDIFLDGLLFQNPVLIGAIGLCPVIAAGTSLKNGVALSLILAVLLLPACLLFSFIGEHVPMWLRPPILLVLSGALYIPARLLTEEILPGVLAAMGIYAPLMVANAIITNRAKHFAAGHIYYAAIVDAAGCAAGFAVVICAVSAVRELLTAGTLWGYPLIVPFAGLPAAAYVSFGFILIGFLSAFVQNVNNRRRKKQHRKERQL